MRHYFHILEAVVGILSVGLGIYALTSQPWYIGLMIISAGLQLIFAGTTDVIRLRRSL